MYKNHDSKNKSFSRSLIYNLTNGNSRQLNIFTLPSTNFYLEKQLLSKPNVNLYCAERNKSIYRKQLNISKNIKIQGNSTLALHYGDAFQTLRQLNTSFDVIWLDLCSSLQSSIINNFLSLIQTGNLNLPAYVAITFVRGREVHVQSIVNAYGAKNIKDFRDNVFPNLISEFAKSVDRKSSIIYEQVYREEGRGKAPMKMYIFKIE